MVRVERARKSLDSSVERPEPLSTTVVWEDWEKSLRNYLQSKDGINWIPLSYIIRPVQRPNDEEDATLENIRLMDLIHNVVLPEPPWRRMTHHLLQDNQGWVQEVQHHVNLHQRQVRRPQ